MIGTTINVTAIVAGSMIGAAVGNRLSDSMRTTVLQGLGLVTAIIGLQMALNTKNYPRFSAISSLLIEDLINFFKIHKKILTNKKKSDKFMRFFT